jgi:hypothetical protein
MQILFLFAGQSDITPVETMYKQKLITKDLKDYLIPKVTQPGKVQGNPKIHKKNHPLSTIINGSNHATEKMARTLLFRLVEVVKCC